MTTAWSDDWEEQLVDSAGANHDYLFSFQADSPRNSGMRMVRVTKVIASITVPGNPEHLLEVHFLRSVAHGFR